MVDFTAPITLWTIQEWVIVAGAFISGYWLLFKRGYWQIIMNRIRQGGVKPKLKPLHIAIKEFQNTQEAISYQLTKQLPIKVSHTSDTYWFLFKNRTVFNIFALEGFPLAILDLNRFHISFDREALDSRFQRAKANAADPLNDFYSFLATLPPEEQAKFQSQLLLKEGSNVPGTKIVKSAGSAVNAGSSNTSG